ncbi:MAG: sigma-54-dependent Fis family transcriptional regulator [Deltaproteobacteria bacterium]|nr:MAG: sigma-54-dependent Fis family transcriptional regulator [Deltaproteobacteria bacterium]
MTVKILVVDDEENICFTLGRFLSDEGYDVTTAEDFDAAVQKINQIDFDLVFVDILLKGRSGIEILKVVTQKNLNCPVVMITGVPTIETASEALRIGAFDYLSKPVLQAGLLKVAKAALRYKKLVDEKERYKANLEAIFANVKDALISVDKDLNIIETNRAAEKICNILRKTSRGKSLRSMEFPCNGQCIKALEKTISLKKSVEYTQVSCGHDKKTGQVVNLTASPLLDRKGCLSGGILAIRDQTRLFRLERDMKMRHKCHNMIGKSEAIQNIFSLVDTLADVKTSVLISGESGTGKELVADALHFKGHESQKPLIKVNCAALSENLLESELFGHVKGAFSGAYKDRVGRFEHADGGTILLDEVGEISPRMQLRLLRVLQEHEFERVGDSATIKVDVRVVAATNLDLIEEVNNGKFRSDLYYRLKIVEIKLPALKKRREDIPLLVAHFIDLFNEQFGKYIESISDDVSQRFMKYPWPGNIRELKHAIEHAFILCKGNILELEHIPLEISQENRSVSNPATKEKFIETLNKVHWNKTKAAKMLNISRQSLYRKMKKYKISSS